MFKWFYFKFWCFFHRKYLKDLKRLNHCTFDLEHLVRPNISYNDSIKDYFNVQD